MKALINPQIINDAQGMPAFAVLPYDVYCRLIAPVDYENSVPSQVVDFAFDNDCSALKAWRVFLGLTQEEVAGRLGISQSAYSQRENAKSLRKAARIECAKALGITPEQLHF